MKKHFIYATLSAIALFGAVSFSACSSSEDVAEDINPTYDGNSVKAQFAISIPSYGKAQTRMDATNTQKSGFLGISNLRLYPFTSSTTSGGEYVVAKASPYSGANVITVDPIGVSGTGMQVDHTAAQDKWYTNVTVPTTTNAFLVYGKATRTGTISDFVRGAIIPSYELTTPSDLKNTADTPAGKLSFKQKQIVTSFGTEGNDIISQLNTIVAASGKLTSEGASTTWCKVGEMTDADATSNGVLLLKNLFLKFTLQTVVSGGYAGSSESVIAMLTDLKETLETQSSYNQADYLTKDIYDKTSAAITALRTAYPISTTTAITSFPGKIGLPDGAAALKYTTSGTAGTAGVFSFVENGNVISNVQVNAISNYVYPAELYYRANTPIRVANKEIYSTISTSDTWENVISKYSATNKAVDAATRSIALVNQLQYAVGCLDTQVTLASTTLTESSPEAENSTTLKTLDVSAGLKLTGILIGSQGDVNWDFTQTTNGSNVIYDREIAETDKITSTSATHRNYTLVMETVGVANPDAAVSADNNEVVYVALEFENDIADFCGANRQLIPIGTKFYLVGALNLNAIGTQGNLNSRKKVFEQDYTTTALFTISSLKNAYNVVPDLRTPTMELGLSVDLAWTPGVTFDVNIQ